MELRTKAVLIKDLQNIEIFNIVVSEPKYLIVKKKLLEQKKLATKITRDLLNEGQITSISRPVNKQMQKELNRLNLAKQTIKKSLKELQDFFK